jgi:branched-chain amino acid transport system substrate-binding protein
MQKRGRRIGSVLFGVTALVAVVGCGSSSSGGQPASGGSPGASASSSGGTVNVAMPTTLSGALGPTGTTEMNGVQLALDQINSSGGLLGKQVHLETADDALVPATAVSDLKQMINDDHAVAVMGPLSSAVAAAEEPIVEQAKIPMFFHGSNDIGLLTTGNKYVFAAGPNSVMESKAVAQILAKQPYTKYATISYDISSGEDAIKYFLSGLKQFGVTPDVVSQQLTPLGTTDFSSTISAVLAKKPEVVVVFLYGADMQTFTKQATTLGLFSQVKQVVGSWATTDLEALGSQAPAGAISYSRAPFYAIQSSEIAQFTSDYKAKYNTYPGDFAILGYSAAEMWADGVRKAGTFDGDAVSDALAGSTVSTVLGNVTIRACDHQAEVPEYVGTLSSSVDSTYNFRKVDNIQQSDPTEDELTCAQMQALNNG